MINIDKEIIKGNFSKRATSYDSYSGIQAKSALNLLKFLGEADFRDILEIGSGTGIYTLNLRKKFPDAKITAVDISKDMINIAKNKMIEKVNYIEGDAESIKLTGKFDLITSNACMQWFTDFDGFVEKNINDNLKQNGIFCFSIYGPETYKELKRVMKKVFNSSGIEISSDEFLSISNIDKILRKYFSNVFSEEKEYKLSFDSFLELLRSIKLSGTTGKGIGKKVFFGRKNLKKAQEFYVDYYGGIKATHQVAFFKAKRI